MGRGGGGRREKGARWGGLGQYGDRVEVELGSNGKGGGGRRELGGEGWGSMGIGWKWS